MREPSWRIAALAARDLDRIGRQSARRWGLPHARSYLRRIELRFDFLARNPELGAPRDEIRPGVKSFPEGAHIIYYRRLEGSIRILRIRHHRMDLRRLEMPG